MRVEPAVARDHERVGGDAVPRAESFAVTLRVTLDIHAIAEAVDAVVAQLTARALVLAPAEADHGVRLVQQPPRAKQPAEGLAPFKMPALGGE